MQHHSFKKFFTSDLLERKLAKTMDCFAVKISIVVFRCAFLIKRFKARSPETHATLQRNMYCKNVAPFIMLQRIVTGWPTTHNI